MADDMMAALLPALIGGSGGGGGGMSPDAMGALEAMQASPFAQGVPSQSGPVGQIIQALMPVLAGPAYAQQARQKQSDHQRDTLVKVLTLAKSMEGIDLKKDEMRQAAEAAGVTKDFYQKWLHAHDAINGGDPIKDAKMTLNSKGGMSFTMGGGPGKERELDLIKQVAGPGAGPQAVLDALAKQKQSEAGGVAMARVPAEVEASRLKAAAMPKKVPSHEQLDKWNTEISSLDAITRSITAMPDTTSGDFLLSMATGGALSNQAIRDYAKYWNDVDQARAGARGYTRFALERIKNELPTKELAISNPKEFMKQLRQAKTNSQQRLMDDLTSAEETVRVPDYIKQRATAYLPKPSAVPATPGQPAIDFNDAGLNTAFKNISRRFPKMSAEEMADYYSAHGDPN